MNPSDEKKGVDEVEVFHRANRLKAKAGGHEDGTGGQISPEAVEAADASIRAMCKDCPRLVSAALAELVDLWGQMRDMPPSDERAAIAQKIFTFAHEVKDLASTCGYTLMADFGESLRDYILETQIKIDAQRIIIQAHIDAMQAAYREGTMDEGSPMAQELKAAVKKAMAQHK